MARLLSEECQEIDRMFGAQGALPLPAFQSLMADYDLAMLESDVRELRSRKFILEDSDRNELVKYLELLRDATPVERASLDSMEKVGDAAVRIQALIRGFLAR